LGGSYLYKKRIVGANILLSIIMILEINISKDPPSLTLTQHLHYILFPSAPSINKVSKVFGEVKIKY